jgi:beta-glucanase (GH16 family)
MPSFSTGTWPAFWLLDRDCQNSNKYTGDTGVDSCPYVGENGYIEIDTTECFGGESAWCQFHVANPNFGIGNGCDAVYSVSTGQHTFQTVWTADNIKQYLDGTLVTTCNQSLNAPMFFIAQIQSATSSGMIPDDANLPAVMTLNSVTVTDTDGDTLFSDDFPNQN